MIIVYHPLPIIGEIYTETTHEMNAYSISHFILFLVSIMQETLHDTYAYHKPENLHDNNTSISRGVKNGCNLRFPEDIDHISGSNSEI